MSGIIDDQLLVVAVLNLVGEPVVELLLEDHVLGGILTQVHVLGGYAKGFLAVLGKHGRIILGEGHV